MKKNKNKKLSNLIASEKYYELKETEKYDFLVQNAIYTKRNSTPEDARYTEHKDGKKRWFLEEYYTVNPIIIKDIIASFLKCPIDTSDIKDKIEVAIATSLEVKETLKEWYKKYNDVITESDINPLEFYEDTKINRSKLKTYITNHFKSPTCGCMNLRNVEAYIFTMELDLYSISFFEELIKVMISMDILHFLKGQTANKVEEKSKSRINQLTVRQAVMLIEEMQRIENWSECDATKKAVVIGRLIGRDASNIREVYSDLGKKPSELPPKFGEDMQAVIKLLKNSKLI